MARRSSPEKRDKRVAEPAAEYVVGVVERVDRLVQGFGNNRVADLLGVSRSQPSRWRRRLETIGPKSQRAVLDLDYVLARLLRLYPKELADLWLTSYNHHLGARPVDVLQMEGARPVIDAIDAEEQGAYA